MSNALCCVSMLSVLSLNMLLSAVNTEPAEDWEATGSTHVATETLIVYCCLLGSEYEQRLRQLHARLHPRTGWARRNKAAALPSGNSSDEGYLTFPAA